MINVVVNITTGHNNMYDLRVATGPSISDKNQYEIMKQQLVNAGGNEILKNSIIPRMIIM
jgi:hypothetical protein